MLTGGVALAAALVALLLLPSPETTQAATLPSGFTETKVVSGLAAPTAMEFAPDGRLFVTEQRGQVRVIKNGQRFHVELRDAPGGRLRASGLSLDAYGGNPVPGAWTVYTIPLADLNGADRPVSGIVIQDNTGGAQPVVYVDSIALVGGSDSGAPASATPAAATAPAPAPAAAPPEGDVLPDAIDLPPVS